MTDMEGGAMNKETLVEVMFAIGSSAALAAVAAFNDVYPLNQQPTRLVTHRGREAGERGAMTAQIINLTEARAEREPRTVSIFEFWHLFWFGGRPVM
jgi:hypothetical protein